MNDGYAYVTNNTVVMNTNSSFAVDDPIGGIYVGGTGEYLIANNNLWGNEGSDLELRSSEVRLYRNNIGVRTGQPPDQESHNLSVEPEYESDGLDFTPLYSSPLVNAR